MDHSDEVRLTGRSLGRPEGSSGARTRARLLQIAATLFANNGFSGVTLADVAGAAGLTAPSIYNHFSSKDELFIATVTMMLSEIHLGFVEVVDKRADWQTNLGNILDAAETMYREDGVLQKLGGVSRMEARRAPEKFAAINAAERENISVFIDIISWAAARGDIDENINVEIAGELLAAMVLSAIASVSNRRSSHVEFKKITDTFRVLFL